MKNGRSALVPLALLLLTAITQAQVDTAWVRRWDGGERDEDWASDMAVDQQGNVYVLGTAYAGNLTMDITLTKYDSSGQLLWTAVHDGAENNEDSAAAMVLDPNGNIYICGWSFQQPGRGLGMITIKYGPDGDSSWLACYDHVGDFEDMALDICLDGAGHVAVTGFVTDSFMNFNYCTIAYDTASGDTAWMQFYNRAPEDDEDVATAICSDGAGTVYVTGYSYDDGTDYDITTIRYLSDGTRHWTRRKNYYPFIDDDYGVDIAWNPVTSTVVVGGYVYDDNHDYDYFTMAYDADGDSVWARAYNRYPANDEDLLTALTVDAGGNVIVTGTSFAEATDGDMTTVRYSPSGIQQWVARYDYDQNFDGGVHVTTDSLRQVFVTGYGEDWENTFDILTVKHDTLGQVLWGQSYDFLPVSYEDYGCRVLPQFDGHVYVLGTSDGDVSDFDVMLFKYYELSHDIGVVSLGVPDSLYLGDSVVPEVVFRNWALMNADSCWLRLAVGWTDDYAESVWVSVGPGETDTVLFPAWTPDTIGTALLRLRSALPGDQRLWNDTISAPVVVWSDTVGLAGKEPLAPRELSLALRPNPVRGRALVRMTLPGNGPAEMRLYNVTGAQVIPEQRFAVRSGRSAVSVQLDLRRLPAGVYFLKLVQDGVETGQKLVVQR